MVKDSFWDIMLHLCSLINTSLPMGILNYPRHFSLLGCGSVVLFLLTRLPVSLPYDRFCFLFGLSGGLHAIAVVLALRSESSRLFHLGFVAAAAALSITAPFVAVELIGLFGLHGIATIFLALALTSAIGAASYWLLVRGFWTPFLSPLNLLVAVGSCVLAILIASFAISTAPSLRDALLPMVWWFAFSASLFAADRHNAANSAPELAGNK